MFGDWCPKVKILTFITYLQYSMIRRILIFVTILLVLDIYLFTSFRNYFSSNFLKTGFKWFYSLSMIISYSCFAIVVLKFDDRPTHGTILMNLWFGYTFAWSSNTSTLSCNTSATVWRARHRPPQHDVGRGSGLQTCATQVWRDQKQSVWGTVW